MILGETNNGLPLQNNERRLKTDIPSCKIHSHLEDDTYEEVL
jgi:hypothetical protein